MGNLCHDREVIIRPSKPMARFVLSQGQFRLSILMIFLLAVSPLNGRAESVVALAFDGVNDFVEIAPGLVLGSTFTEEAWILPENKDKGYHGFLGFPIGSPQRAPSFWVAYGAGLHAGFGDGKKWYSVATDPDVLTLRAWNHVAATYDGTTYHVYANGIEVVNKKIGATPFGKPVTRIGRADNNAFVGAIREVRFWDRARTAQEIRQDMNRQLQGTEDGLVAYYRLDDGSGDTARNFALPGGTGILRNGPHWITSAAAKAPAASNPRLWEGRDGIEAHSPTGTEAAPNAAIEITFRSTVSEADSHLIRLTVDDEIVKPEATTTDTGNVLIRYEPTEPFEPGSKHTVKLSYVTRGPRKTNEFSYNFSVSTSILLSK